MNADIETFLDVAKEATAKRIAERISMPHLDVAKELNRMHADGVVEREKRKGGGNEYVYWLARADVQVKSTTDDEVAKLDAAIEQAPSPVEKPAVDQGASTVGEAFEKLCGQTRELLDVLGLPPTMKDAIAVARTMVDIARETSIERDELRAEVDSQRTANARLKTNNAELERRIDELTLGPAGAKAPLFVTVGRYSKPMRHDSIEKAKKRGSALVRGEKESEVLVLEPIGRIVRGTEWRPQ